MTKKTQRRLMQVASYQENHGATTSQALEHERKLRRWCRQTAETYVLGSEAREQAWYAGNLKTVLACC